MGFHVQPAPWLSHQHAEYAALASAGASSKRTAADATCARQTEGQPIVLTDFRPADAAAASSPLTDKLEEPGTRAKAASVRPRWTSTPVADAREQTAVRLSHAAEETGLSLPIASFERHIRSGPTAIDARSTAHGCKTAADGSSAASNVQQRLWHRLQQRPSSSQRTRPTCKSDVELARHGLQ